MEPPPTSRSERQVDIDGRPSSTTLWPVMAGPKGAHPWAVCAAASERQADRVFNTPRLMCELSPSATRRDQP